MNKEGGGETHFRVSESHGTWPCGLRCGQPRGSDGIIQGRITGRTGVKGESSKWKPGLRLAESSGSGIKAPGLPPPRSQAQRSPSSPEYPPPPRHRHTQVPIRAWRWNLPPPARVLAPPLRKFPENFCFGPVWSVVAAAQRPAVACLPAGQCQEGLPLWLGGRPVRKGASPGGSSAQIGGLPTPVHHGRACLADPAAAPAAAWTGLLCTR